MEGADLGFTTTLYSIHDSLINGKRYHVIHQEDKPFWSINDFLIHEDTIAGIWTIRNDTTEYEWMNLNLIKGDTFKLYYNSYQFYTRLIVDSVYFKNGNKVIDFGENLFYNDGCFHESIGPDIFILNGDFPINAVLCKKINDSLIFTEYSTCNVYWMGMNEIENNSITIYPNPSKGKFILISNETNYNNILINVFNLRGIDVTNQCLIKSNSIEIKQSGVYLIQITNNTKSYFQKVIVD
jgi:hypothetical protein